MPDERNINTCKYTQIDMKDYLGFGDTMLGTQKFKELLEHVSTELGAEKPFRYMFMVSGRKIELLDDVPRDVRALIVSSKPRYSGIRRSKKSKQETAKNCVEKWLERGGQEAPTFKPFVVPRRGSEWGCNPPTLAQNMTIALREFAKQKSRHFSECSRRDTKSFDMADC